VQYVGATEEGTEHITEVQQGNMRVVFVTDECMTDPDLLEDVAHCLASHLECDLAMRDDRWLELNSQLREQVPPPAFAHMRLTMADVERHIRD
jgi:DNA-binding NarL/FixJ family response regulator